MFDVIGVCLTLTALLAYLNHRFVGLPPTIGIMGIALIISASMLGLDAVGFSILNEQAARLLASINFSVVLMQGMLPTLTYAVVVFSIAVQGMSIGALVRRHMPTPRQI